MEEDAKDLYDKMGEVNDPFKDASLNDPFGVDDIVGKDDYKAQDSGRNSEVEEDELMDYIEGILSGRGGEYERRLGVKEGEDPLANFHPPKGGYRRTKPEESDGSDSDTEKAAKQAKKHSSDKAGERSSIGGAAGGAALTGGAALSGNVNGPYGGAVDGDDPSATPYGGLQDGDDPSAIPYGGHQDGDNPSAQPYGGDKDGDEVNEPYGMDVRDGPVGGPRSGRGANGNPGEQRGRNGQNKENAAERDPNLYDEGYLYDPDTDPFADHGNKPPVPKQGQKTSSDPYGLDMDDLGDYNDPMAGMVRPGMPKRRTKFGEEDDVCEYQVGQPTGSKMYGRCYGTRHEAGDIKIMVDVEGMANKKAFFIDSMTRFNGFKKAVEKKVGKLHALCYKEEGIRELVEVDDDETLLLFIERGGKLVLIALKKAPKYSGDLPAWTVHDCHVQYAGSARPLPPVDTRPAPHTIRAPALLAFSNGLEPPPAHASHGPSCNHCGADTTRSFLGGFGSMMSINGAKIRV